MARRLRPDEVDAATRALLKTAGKWGSASHSDKQIDIGEQYNAYGFALYGFKATWLTKRAVPGQIFSISTQGTRQGREFWAQVRGKHRAAVKPNARRARTSHLQDCQALAQFYRAAPRSLTREPVSDSIGTRLCVSI
jgi:hypothetical protein